MDWPGYERNRMNIKSTYRVNLALLLLALSVVTLAPQASAATCSENCLSVYSVSLTDLGTSIRSSVKVIDEFVNSGASRNATVQGLWTRPDGSTVLQYARIGTRLRADFSFGTGGVPGTYTFEVIDITKSGYTFDPNGGADLTASITIQNTYNQPPVAVINSDRLSGKAPLNVNFDGMSSHDPDGTIASYLWSFGDGTRSYESNPSHTYIVSGTFTATLTVLDDMGARGTDSVSVVVTEPQSSTPEGCQTQCLSLSEISLNLKRDRMIGKVRILDENGSNVSDVAVEAAWTLPDGSVVNQTQSSGGRQQATFKIPVHQSGIYTLEVTGLSKSGYQYVPERNAVDSRSFLVE